MGKARAIMACTACGAPASRWSGRCPSCDAWGSIAERSPVASAGAVPQPLWGPEDHDRRIATGMDGVDRVLGGGLVPGSVVLLAGEPGIGKSTLVLQLVGALSRAGQGCLVASGEESRAQVAARARRLGLPADAASFVPGRDLPTVLEAARATKPAVLAVDSVQSIRDPSLTAGAGGPAQVRLCTDALVGLAKDHGIVVVMAGQVTKDGDVAGPRTLEHAVDVVCSFDGDPRTGLRVLAGGKNRFGPEGEVAWFEMGPEGLVEVDPSDVLSSSDGAVGAATALVGAGRRALAVEVQALAAFTDGPPRRSVSGLDPRRFGIVAAVVDRAVGLRLLRAELYGASTGGLVVTDPGADLAVAAALASAASGRPPPPGAAFVGEVGLTGVVRTAPGYSQRLSAAASAGVHTVFGPPGGGDQGGVRRVAIGHVREALAWARGDR